MTSKEPWAEAADADARALAELQTALEQLLGCKATKSEDGEFMDECIVFELGPICFEFWRRINGTQALMMFSQPGSDVPRRVENATIPLGGGTTLGIAGRLFIKSLIDGNTYRDTDEAFLVAFHEFLMLLGVEHKGIDPRFAITLTMVSALMRTGTFDANKAVEVLSAPPAKAFRTILPYIETNTPD